MLVFFLRVRVRVSLQGLGSGFKSGKLRNQGSVLLVILQGLGFESAETCNKGQGWSLSTRVRVRVGSYMQLGLGFCFGCYSLRVRVGIGLQGFGLFESVKTWN